MQRSAISNCAAADAETDHGGYSNQKTTSPLIARPTIRRAELRRLVPVGDTTIYEMERRGEFPRRFFITPRCVVWDLGEVMAWIEERRRSSDADQTPAVRGPDVGRRKHRPVRR
jgi:prophage regulatory protein